MTDLSDTAHTLVALGKGILAADESVASADKRLELYGITPSEDVRQKFRDLFLSTPGAEEYLSGVILFSETLDQKATSKKLFSAELLSRGIVPGIKVDLGTESMPESPKELITKGLLGLAERLADFRTKYDTGFTKWRAVVRIEGDVLPSTIALRENMKRLATYACEVQKAGMVPMVEPEVLLEGNHSRIRAKEVITQALEMLVDAMREQAVDLSAVIVKTSMALSGSDTKRIDTPEEVAEDTLDALMKAVPAEIPGIVFLSGGQTPDQATDNLRAIATRAAEKKAPWPLTFSYARALQEEALHIWKGEDANIPAAREAFLKRLETVTKAAQGE